MRFPRTHVDESRERLDVFAASLKLPDGSPLVLDDKKVFTTGTTVAAFLSRDKKVGVIASDGRVSYASYSMTESFKKIFDCRIGFVGFAGALTLVQRLVPVFRADLQNICDSRGRTVTATGAARRLFQYYLAVGGSHAAGEIGGLAMISLFWDAGDERCHLYLFEGMSLLSRDYSTAIGSGSPLITPAVKNYQPLDSLEDIIRCVRKLFIDAADTDKGTNNRIFYGIIANGNFEEKEEVLQ